MNEERYFQFLFSWRWPFLIWCSCSLSFLFVDCKNWLCLNVLWSPNNRKITVRRPASMSRWEKDLTCFLWLSIWLRFIFFRNNLSSSPLDQNHESIVLFRQQPQTFLHNFCTEIGRLQRIYLFFIPSKNIFPISFEIVGQLSTISD